MKCLMLLAALSLLVPSVVQAAEAKRTLYHVVSLKFKPEATAEQIKAVETSFAELKEKIPTITSLQWGTNVSPEKHAKGFTHCFVVTFADAKGRD